MHEILRLESMSRIQKIVLAAAVTLFLVWFAFHFGRLIVDEDGSVSTEREVCIVLGVVFSLAILFRPERPAEGTELPDWVVPAAGVAGLAATLLGIVFDTRQLDWLGVLLLLYAGLRWSLPQRFSASIPPALLLLYWVHPVPFSIFGPLQLAMQNTSVQGAEWLAHCLNVPAWADGTVLLTETCTLDVPQACSGMTTALAVVVSCLGTGLLFRMRWYSLTGLVLLGLLQVLMLNILRIGLMAIAAPHMPPEWISGFLHDSLGLLLVAAIVLVQIEAAILLARHSKRMKREKAIETGVAEPEDRASTVHPFWRYLSRYVRIIIATVVILAAAAGILYKRRPAHRSRMIHRLVENLAITNLAGAERAAAAAVHVDRNNLTARYSLAQILVFRRKYDQALAELERIPAGRSTVPSTVIKAQALAGKKQLADALALINSLAENERRLPPVAMVRAEMAAEQNDVKCVADNVILAASSSSPTLLKRIRALFPFLASKEEWRAIVKCDRPLPYTEPVHAGIAVDAYLHVQDIPGMARTLGRVIKTWPEDPTFLTHLLAMAVLRPEGDWERLFVNNFLKNLPTLDNDRLAACLQHCFRLRRPDLAWLAYRRLSSVDPHDPTLYLAVSQFADKWFSFRMNYLGMSAPSLETTVDLRLLCRHTRDTWPMNVIWKNVPLGDELTADPTGDVPNRYLHGCIDELERRERTGSLNLRNQMMFVTALTMAGRLPEAGRRLDKLDRIYPERKLDVLNKRLLLSDLNRDWNTSYEVSREYISIAQHTGIAVSLSQINALVRLHLGMHALAVAERTHNLFPDSAPITLALAALLDVYGFEEEGLFLLSKVRGVEGAPLGAILLYDTERFFEADRFAVASGRSGLLRADRRQNLLMPAAEMTITPPRQQSVPSRAEMDRLAAQFESEAEAATSPYVRNLKRLIAGWYKTGGSPGNSDPAKWEAAGRDDTERALALHELATLLVMQNKVAATDGILSRATTLLPDSALLWQFRVAASSGRSDLVEQARRACPSNPEIWLAWLVTRTRDSGAGAWALREIQQATDRPLFSAGTIVRAGDFLLRAGMTGAAVVAAKHSIKQANGLLPAYVLGLRCALTTGDMNWALQCASQAAVNSLDPAIFEKTVADIRRLQGGQSTDLTTILNKLRSRFPNDPRWHEQLGAIYFQKGDMRAVSSVFESIVANDLVNHIQAPSLIMTAEAARLEGRNGEATRILEGAFERFPDNLDILNNYIFILAQDPSTIDKAKELLPRLLSKGALSGSVCDTAAVVYLRAGDLRRADDYSRRALQLLQPGDYAADEVHLNAVEINILLGDFEKARNELKLLRKGVRRPTIVENRRNSLLASLSKKGGSK